MAVQLRPGEVGGQIPVVPAMIAAHRHLVAPGAVLAGLFAMSGTALAHHSFAMFDQEHPIELVGTVTEFKYSSPHCYIFLDVKGADGSSTVWNLEGGAPSLLLRDGWSSKSIKPGDELRMRFHERITVLSGLLYIQRAIAMYRQNQRASRAGVV